MQTFSAGHQCPRCRNLLTPGQAVCVNCGMRFDWKQPVPPPVVGSVRPKVPVWAIVLCTFALLAVIGSIALSAAPKQTEAYYGVWKGSDGTVMTVKDKDHMTVEKNGVIIECSWGIDYEPRGKVFWTIPESVNGAEVTAGMDDINSSTIVKESPNELVLDTVRGGQTTYSKVR